MALACGRVLSREVSRCNGFAWCSKRLFGARASRIERCEWRSSRERRKELELNYSSSSSSLWILGKTRRGLLDARRRRFGVLRHRGSWRGETGEEATLVHLPHVFPIPSSTSWGKRCLNRLGEGLLRAVGSEGQRAQNRTPQDVGEKRCIKILKYTTGYGDDRQLFHRGRSRSHHELEREVSFW